MTDNTPLAKAIYRAFYPSQSLAWEQLGSAVQDTYLSAARAARKQIEAETINHRADSDSTPEQSSDTFTCKLTDQPMEK
jgi:hypothetical protein